MNFDRFSPPLLSVLRIMTALLLLQYGLMKLVHFPGPQPGAPDPLTPLLLAATVIEVIGGGLSSPHRRSSSTRLNMRSSARSWICSAGG